ncbi:hypothetical protein SAMN05421736_101689 [Evansella caseinilytica]|uniref:GH16 domain-containing protein n=1 Tax=Evansella caseinilytica TaxID=1503961 RepID=A0A1H3I3N0_9BACI|nr:glycoside hydrolase family 16 protein [Evansella caseinilytica]SDY21708.1 hypothetical protein SAMN05421736_101689 [Evansella caseinilytica]
MAQGRTINWSGYTWHVKDSFGSKWGPGPNYFSSSNDNVWVDSAGRLHLKITQRNGNWYCAEVYHTQTLGYGTYRFFIDGRPDLLDPNITLGLFTYDSISADAPAKNYREIDIEFAKWGHPQALNSQYVVQPYTKPANMLEFQTSLNGYWSTHSFNWTPSEVKFMSLHGHYSDPPSPLEWYLIKEWSYNGEDIPDSKNERVDVNLWLMDGRAPFNQQETEIVITKFEFTPM